MFRPAMAVAVGLALARVAGALPSDAPLELHDARFGHAAVVISNTIYVAAGHGNAGILGSIERIPADRSRVEPLPASVTPRYWVGGATDGARLYLAGGIGEDGVTDRFEAWTPGEAEPRALAPLPEPRSRIALVHLEGKLYAIGGAAANGQRTGRVEIYDIATDTWTRGADMPTPRECDAEVFEGRIVAPGGYDGTVSVAVVEFYDPASDAWSPGPPMPLPQSAHRLAVVDRSLYAFGHFHAPDRVTVLDSETGSWSLLDLGYERSRHNDAVFDGREVYVLGGNTRTQPPYLGLVQHYTRAQLAAAPRRAPTEAERKGAQRDAAGVDEDVADRLQEWLAVLRRLPHLRVERREVVSRAGGKTIRDITMAMSWRPGRFSLRTADRMFVFDGTNAFRTFPARSAYIATPAGAIGEAASRTRQVLSDCGIDIAALTSRQPARRLREHFATRPWTLLPDALIGGEPCWILESDESTEGIARRETIGISKTTGIIMRRTLEVDPTPSDDPDARHTILESTILSIDTTTPPPDSDFAWAPPPGTQPIAPYIRKDPRATPRGDPPDP